MKETPIQGDKMDIQQEDIIVPFLKELRLQMVSVNHFESKLGLTYIVRYRYPDGTGLTVSKWRKMEYDYTDRDNSRQAGVDNACVPIGACIIDLTDPESLQNISKFINKIS